MSQRLLEQEEDLLVRSLRRDCELEHRRLAKVKRDRELKTNIQSTLCFSPKEHRKRAAPVVEQIEAPSTPPQSKEPSKPVPAPSSRCIGVAIDDGETTEVWNRKVAERKVRDAHDLYNNGTYEGQSLSTGDGALLLLRIGTAAKSVDVEHAVEGKTRVEPALPLVEGKAQEWMTVMPVFGIKYDNELILQSSKEPKAKRIEEASDVVAAYMRTKELYRFDGPGPREIRPIGNRRWVFGEKVGASGSLQPILTLTEDGVERGEVLPVVSPAGGWARVSWE